MFEAEGGRICICDGWRTTDGVDRGAAWAPAEIGEAMEAAAGAGSAGTESLGDMIRHKPMMRRHPGAGPPWTLGSDLREINWIP